MNKTSLKLSDEVLNTVTGEMGVVVDKWHAQKITIRTNDNKGKIYIEHWDRDILRPLNTEQP